MWMKRRTRIVAPIVGLVASACAISRPPAARPVARPVAANRSFVAAIDAQLPKVRDLMSDTWVGTDALGRALATFPTERLARCGRFVGMLYNVSHGSEQWYRDRTLANEQDHGGDPTGPLANSTEIIASGGGSPLTNAAVWTTKGYWWAEPAVGYFLADDPWVARKNLGMLADAGVDVLIIDVTNNVPYTVATRNLFDVAHEMRAEGNPTPQLMFVTHFDSDDTVNKLYDRIYSQGLYEELWFRWEGKPLILAQPPKPNFPPHIKEFFTWRDSWSQTDGPTSDNKDEWQLIDLRGPQKLGWHISPNIPEEMPVAVGGWPATNQGRSYQVTPNGGTEPPLGPGDLAPDVAKGVLFSTQWRRALTVDPSFVFVSGWNEWTAVCQPYEPNSYMLGKLLQPGQCFFVDEYNQEFSRDAMPMKGGHADNYYMQLANYVRQFKGVRPVPSAHGWDAAGLDNESWRWITPEYRDAVGDTAPRDWDGAGGNHYVDSSGRNDIVSAKVAVDDKDIKFYVKTAVGLSPATDDNWMQLLIDIDQDSATGWNGYEFVANVAPRDGAKTTLRSLVDGRTWQVKYRAAPAELVLIIPRAPLGLLNRRKVNLDFHWIDNLPVGTGGVERWWYDGENAPDGRFNYRYWNEDSVCVSTATDFHNCGRCGHACDVEERCVAGSCRKLDNPCTIRKPWCDKVVPPGCRLPSECH